MDIVVKIWKNKFILTGTAFSLIFLLEILLFYDIIIVDPAVHHISYENWKWFLFEWTPPEYWAFSSSSIIAGVKLLSTTFQILFGGELVFIFINNEKFLVKKRTIVLTLLILIAINILVCWYIKYNVEFYHPYMYSIFTELLGLYIICYGNRLKET